MRESTPTTDPDLVVLPTAGRDRQNSDVLSIEFTSRASEEDATTANGITTTLLHQVPTVGMPSEHLSPPAKKKDARRALDSQGGGDAHSRSSIETMFSDPTAQSDLHLVAESRYPTSLRSPSPAASPSPSSSTIATTNTTTPTTPSRWLRLGNLGRIWVNNKGVAMVMIAQFFGASMNVMTQTLQLDGPHGKGMHPFQVLFARMSLTVLCSGIYMWYKRVPNPLGVREVQPLLVLRGVSGFFGVCGLYYSLQYLPLSEATVLTFLAPIASCYACSLILPNESFTRKQQVAGLISLIGVVLIARPVSLFSKEPASTPPPPSTPEFTPSNSTNTDPDPSDPTNLDRHLFAVGAGLIGVLGATIAYTSIRWIGQRAHALVSVTYFSFLTTVISILALLFIPGIDFRFPGNITELALLLGLGLCGFLLQFLLTAGLAYAPPPPPPVLPTTAPGTVSQPPDAATAKKPSTHGSRATQMVYTQMLFALFYDKIVWDTTPSAISWTGSAIILSCAIYVAFAREETNKKKTPVTVTQIIGGDANGDGDHGQNGHASVSAAAGEGDGRVDEEEEIGSEGARGRRKWSVSDERRVEEGRGLLQDYDRENH
ncbi:hypothetical protein AJ80_04233 [Polytolypa hystricis UAMH7299]|uniref:EamA domain-containing protein n=1 Tax=Polytolypa hystricis (strain UAMH7299) TaxID=1447883 RepID=A0A2B7YDN5_POLH7|nr:hypothetical protein AJ80_04233 [Polytolypa hystricis UAMH7299]